MSNPRDGSLMGRLMKRLEHMEAGAFLSSVEISDEFDVALSSVRPCLASWVTPGWLMKEKRGNTLFYALASANVPDGDDPAGHEDEDDVPFNCALYLDGDLIVTGSGVELLQDGGAMLRPAAVLALRAYLAATTGVSSVTSQMNLLNDLSAPIVPIFGSGAD